MDWCVKPFTEANHPPIVRLKDAKSISAKAKDVMRLDASGTVDPDGDELTFEWFVYREAGTCLSDVRLVNERQSMAQLTVPDVTESCQLHVIVTVRDKGTPPLARYARCVIIVE
jgi:hypothetical protein